MNTPQRLLNLQCRAIETLWQQYRKRAQEGSPHLQPFARDRSGKNVGIKNDIGIMNDETVATNPVEREPKRIDIVRNCERSILEEVNPLTVAPLSTRDVIDDLFLLRNRQQSEHL